MAKTPKKATTTKTKREPTLLDATRKVLASGGEMTRAEIDAAVAKKAGYAKDEKPQTYHALKALLKSKDIRKVGRGKYVLKAANSKGPSPAVVDPAPKVD